MNPLDTLKTFCGDGSRDVKWSTTEPYVIDDYTYCTDTVILGRVKGKLVETAPEKERRFPPVTKICKWDEQFPLKSLCDLPNKKIFTRRVRCGKCDGTGQFDCKCPLCHDYHDCEGCKGKGNILADDTFSKIKIGKLVFNGGYIKKIINLPNLKASIVDQILLFESGGIEGCLMSIEGP